ncbi:flagellar motor stator protein MotA [Methylobacterium sp. E-041]|uniref:flagellar motor stator protein MotA n=1 Tax=Methylobacterium sp. E-041 TaxID=2836573 RepID=UPI001FB96584|nr:flagellar motor stator protein MotA [Methylobacterium sp. E-041]MCJ2105833.1 flagellar motor stator protein MotA [Methylobacterium sp. E-041]
MGVIIGFIIAVSCLLGSFYGMGGHLGAIWQPFEFLIIGGVAFGAFVIANPAKVVRDSGRALVDALVGRVPSHADHLGLLRLLYALMRELRAKPRNEVEQHLENPAQSEIFKAFPSVTRDPGLTTFICDYARLILIGNARPHEIEALMDEEIGTHRRDRLKVYSSLMTVAEGLPALGIVAAVLGIVKAMGALDQSPALLGSLIGAALIGTFTGIFVSYGIVSPLAHKVKATRESQWRAYIIVKQTLLAYMNGALPQIAVEHGRKAISSAERPTIDEVENATTSGGSRGETVQREREAA